MLKQVRNKYFLFINTLIIFTPVFKLLPKWTWIVAGVGILFMLDEVFARSMGYTSKGFLMVFALMSINTITSITIPVFYNTNDFTYAPIFVGLILCTFRAIFLSSVFRKLYRDNATIDYYIEFFVNSCILYFSFTVLFVIFPQFKEFWMNSVIIPVEGSDYFAYKYRYGLDGFAAFGTATIFSLGIILSAYLVIANNLTKKEFSIRLIKYILVCSGSFFYGRICIFAIAISLLYIFTLCKSRKKLSKIFICLVIIFGSAYLGIVSISRVNQDIKVWVDWSFEIIVNLFNGDIKRSYSVSHMLEDMYFIPSLKTIMFGDGRYKAIIGEGYYMSTDVGFMRPLLFFGIFGLGINYSMLIIILKKIYSYFSKLKNKSGKVLVISILLITAILEMKGEAFHRVLYCILPIYFIQYNNLNDKRGELIKSKVQTIT